MSFTSARWTAPPCRKSFNIGARDHVPAKAEHALGILNRMAQIFDGIHNPSEGRQPGDWLTLTMDTLAHLESYAEAHPERFTGGRQARLQDHITGVRQAMRDTEQLAAEASRLHDMSMQGASRERA